MINLVICGGSGTRLWPLSRNLMPKQFAKLINNKSLFQLVLERNSAFCNDFYIISNVDHFFLAHDQMDASELNKRTIKDTRYMLEPVGRNTAPAIALACLTLKEDDMVLVSPSDHLIKNHEAYEKAVARAAELAEKGNIVVFGVKPTHVETGYGYIEVDGENVISFTEKPDEKTAESFLANGNYYWNGGMFCFRAGRFLEELQKYAPEIYDGCKAALENTANSQYIRIGLEDMLKIPEDSIDYSVIEKCDCLKVVISDLVWSDVGSFDSLSAELINDDNNNLIISNKYVATIDVKDTIVVDTDDALLICKKGSSQKVKDVVQKIKRDKPELANIHMTAYRPWGTYTVLENTYGYKIKRIEVKPGKKLSLQRHMHRSEHWIVVSGTATVTVGDRTTMVRPNESTYIKMGELHRLANEGKIPLIVIEAQVGEYTGEDDIIRSEDDYDRG